MKLYEIKKLSDEDLGQELIDSCNFPRDESTPISDLYLLGSGYCYPKNLCTDLNAIAEVEKIVIETVSPKIHLQKLLLTVLDLVFSCEVKVDEIELEFYQIQEIATASARQRAEACLLALTADGE